MNSTGSSVNPPAISRLRLVLPLGIPALVLGLAYGAERAGYYMGAHDIGGVVLVASIFVSILAGLAFELFALPKAIRALWRFPSLRTPMNLAAAGVAAAYLVFAVIVVAYAIA